MPRCTATRCTHDAEPNRRRCAAHLASDREHQRSKRLARLAAGTCVQCDRPPLPGLTRCERHHAIQRAAWTRANVKRKK